MHLLIGFPYNLAVGKNVYKVDLIKEFLPENFPERHERFKKLKQNMES